MTFGTTQKIIVCSPAPSVTSDLCGAGFSPVVTDAFMLAPESSSFFTEFDPELGATVFAASFGLIFTCYIFSRLIGYVLSSFR